MIVVTHPGGQETWQENDELDRLPRELDVPVTCIVAGDNGAPANELRR